MKKLIFVGILGLFVLGSCNNSTVTHTHDEHDHAAEGHNHEAEGPDHSHEGECSGEHNHEAADEYNEAAEAHSYSSRRGIFPWKSNGRYERRQQHSASHYFFKEYRRW